MTHCFRRDLDLGLRRGDRASRRPPGNPRRLDARRRAARACCQRCRGLDPGEGGRREPERPGRAAARLRRSRLVRRRGGRSDHHPRDGLGAGGSDRGDGDRGPHPGQLVEHPARLGPDPARGNAVGDRRTRSRSAHGCGRWCRRGARPPHLDDHVWVSRAVRARPRRPRRRLPRATARARADARAGVPARAHDAPGRARRRAAGPADKAPPPTL